MAKGKLIEQLDHAVEAMMAKPDASLPTSDPRLAAILRIAGELRDLPRAGFKDRLKADLAARSIARGRDALCRREIDSRNRDCAGALRGQYQAASIPRPAEFATAVG